MHRLIRTKLYSNSNIFLKPFTTFTCSHRFFTSSTHSNDTPRLSLMKSIKNYLIQTTRFIFSIRSALFQLTLWLALASLAIEMRWKRLELTQTSDEMDFKIKMLQRKLDDRKKNSSETSSSIPKAQASLPEYTGLV